MFTTEELKNNILGGIEIFLFMPQGIERFSSERNDAIKSFLIPIFLLPTTLYAIVSLSEGYAWEWVVSLHAVRIVLTILAFMMVIYFFSKQLGREEYFFRFLTLSNWLAVPGFFLMLPISYGFWMGYNMSLFESYAVFVTLVSCLYCAFTLTYCFKVPWEMGGFIAIIGLAIDQNLFDLTIYIRDMVAV